MRVHVRTADELISRVTLYIFSNSRCHELMGMHGLRVVASHELA